MFYHIILIYKKNIKCNLDNKYGKKCNAINLFWFAGTTIMSSLLICQAFINIYYIER